ncbi:ABC transporter permease [Chelatococcus asaccharovorans]|uniref:Peptide/nickel transport system permease protein n=1 Tax=Chelatococcus asaccharovorans TaxID=28210 RepID=A0A2V3UER4_9HYPH|nr:ABC transporter permease [Chelatococcus asaccharovorans]MBS7707305.1 ABC transporter permease [Chelatococcus asaccharovorans]PXW63487.1 peptide/nickel transport system permease protein [Chelatococcus asaccharovorans]
MSSATDTTAAAPAPAVPAAIAAQESRLAGASEWRLIWWRFRRHRLAFASGIVVLAIYVIALLADPIAPASTEASKPQYTYAPPQMLHLFRTTDDGWRFEPHVLGYRVQIDPRAMRRSFVTDPDTVIPVGLFVRGDRYSFLGLFESDLHLFGPIEAGQPFFLLGADRLGRDVLSRTIHGARVSMSIGLVGVLMSLAIGVVLGGLSGYLGGLVDSAIQRTIEIIRSIPTIPLWMGLAAAVPLTWHPLAVYFAVTVILSLIGWTTIARIVRGKFLSLRNEDFVVSARLDGASQTRIILVHMLPSFYSYIIAATTLAVPTMILSETALSFIGLGLQPPMVSWGVLLKEAQNIRSLASAPWLFAPGVAVMIAVLSLSFLGDGLRDAADPYQK